MPSGLLVWQIPYREMLSLGLKVSIAVGVACPACAVLSLEVRAVPDSMGGGVLLDVTR